MEGNVREGERMAWNGRILNKIEDNGRVWNGMEENGGEWKRLEENGIDKNRMEYNSSFIDQINIKGKVRRSFEII